ncbi:hypothetical protein [Planktosalinus lacus]|uniref:Uncharacterized protein n=1 Tax=Planktosalinus lacus TaxID=1526573 RepID=A0A8J2YAR7_9FLAO|nr:hypothetical protein [Planktosalinus lacus]GGD99016.1 hypothetical protein GCM10011312_23110 [Planktosalinus lacus]
MYSNLMDKSLKLNKKLASSLSNSELDELMSEFDNYEIESHNNWFHNSKSFSKQWIASFEKLLLYDAEHRKSVNLKQDIIKKNSKQVLFFI